MRSKVLLSELDSGVRAITKRLWPSVDLEPNFSPLLDLDLGDVGSDIAIRLAEALRLKPDEIATRICSEWSPPAGSTASVLNGFLNVRFAPDIEVFTPEPYENYCRDRLAIVVAPFSKSTSRLAEFRMCCSALSQLLIATHLGIDACILLGDEVLKIEQSVVPLVRHVLKKLAACPAHAAATSYPALEVRERCKDFSNISLWIAPHALHRDAFVSFCHDIEERGDALRVIGPAAPWLDFRFHTEALDSFEQWSDEQLLALMWYLSSSAPAADLDFSIARSAERANISWFWNSTRERSARLLPPEAPLPDAPGKSFEVSSILRRLGLRVSYLRTFFVQAAVEGRLHIFMEALSDTLISFNRIFNDPGFRIRQAEARLDPVEIKIIAGAHRSLSDSITLCDFSEGKRYGSHARTPHKTDRTIVGDYE